jgi:FtsP/CotA-like multicopper oxidase with cupredoxin domain
MFNTRGWISLGLLSVFAVPAMAQSFRVQCPTSTITHPSDQTVEPAYLGPTVYGTAANGGGYQVPTTNVNGAIKCQQISGGDGYATMGDGTQTYLFSFGPLSGLADIALGRPGTEFPNVFNTRFPVAVQGGGPNSTLLVNAMSPGYPATAVNASTVPLSATQLDSLVPENQGGPIFNGAVGLDYDVANTVSIYDILEGAGGTANIAAGTPANVVTVIGNAPLSLNLVPGVSQVYIAPQGDIPNGYWGTWTVSAVNIANAFFPASFAFQFVAATTGLAEVSESPDATASFPQTLDGHVDPRQIIDVGIMNGNIPAPLMAIDEDDEFFLTLSNVGMIMRPDLFEQHTVHFHGYPNASAFYDGVPDASVAINIAASFTYYYLAPDAGTYFWHCHITPPEHLQMGMVGQLFVRPRQNRVAPSTLLSTALVQQQGDLRTACRRFGDGGPPLTGFTATSSPPDLLCSNPVPATATTATGGATYAYNDGDGTTRYDVEYPLQMHSFDPNFHFVGMTFNPEGFTDMKDKYWLLNGRSYPDTVSPGPLQTQSSDAVNHFSQPLSAIINIPAGGKALLRISDLNVSEYQTLASLGIPMQVIGYNAKLLRDQAGNNLYYTTNSITLAGGESLDVLLDASAFTSAVYPQLTNHDTPLIFYLYTPNLDHLSNDAENFGGQMTEVHVCTAVDPATKADPAATFGTPCARAATP